MNAWLREAGSPRAAEMAGHAERARAAFNRRFWYEHGGHLYDVVDGPEGDDTACRPNQVFAISLRHPVLDPAHWAAVMETVRKRLLTPVGLRSLAPGHPDYKPKYWGDLRSRDAAYHQGTVWSWLIGPYVEAVVRTLGAPGKARARKALSGLVAHLQDAGLGTVSEIFDGDAPHTPRGCPSQAWSVAELLRAHRDTSVAPRKRTYKLVTPKGSDALSKSARKKGPGTFSEKGV
jgi:glycogen debranching enzyme